MSKYSYEEPKTLKRSNSATKIQARIRGRQKRNNSRAPRGRNPHRQSSKEDDAEITLKRSNSATKIQSRVRGRQERNRHDKSNKNFDHINTTNDPELERLRNEVERLQTKYKQHRQNGEKGKLQMALLDFDIANEELLRAMAYRDAARNKHSNRECSGMMALLCLPCLLGCQFCCCVSTGAVGERSRTVKERDETLGKLKELGSDFIGKKRTKKKKKKKKGRGGPDSLDMDRY